MKYGLKTTTLFLLTAAALVVTSQTTKATSWHCGGYLLDQGAAEQQCPLTCNAHGGWNRQWNSSFAEAREICKQDCAEVCEQSPDANDTCRKYCELVKNKWKNTFSICECNN